MKSLKTFITTGSAFGAVMGIPTCVLVSLLGGVAVGIFMGLIVALASGTLFGLMVTLFTAYQRKVFEKQKLEFKEEVVLYDGPANHLINHRAIGGWLFLTDKRLLFRSHKFEPQPHEWSLPLSEIGDVRTAMTLRVVPNGLRIHSTSGQIDHFVVEGNRRWREQVLAAKARAA